MRIIQLRMALNPGDWRLLPWIRTIHPTAEGIANGCTKGWMFTWLFVCIVRYRMAKP